jgi:hypothetical protein
MVHGSTTHWDWSVPATPEQGWAAALAEKAQMEQTRLRDDRTDSGASVPNTPFLFDSVFSWKANAINIGESHRKTFLGLSTILALFPLCYSVSKPSNAVLRSPRQRA